MIENIVNILDKCTPYIAYISLIVSVFNAFSTWKRERKNRFDIKVLCSDAYLFPAIDTKAGNRYSLTFNIRIINNSSSPIQISDIRLMYPNFSVSCEQSGYDYRIQIQNSEGFEVVDFQNSIILLPAYIPAYGEYQSRVLISRAGSEYPSNLNTKKLEIITSRGNKKVNIRIPSIEYQNTFFK